jgi:CoA:oxalate CoA-transferase
MSSALQGIRVLDLTNVLAGPFCAYQLALLGAEVIKVEVPGTATWRASWAPTRSSTHAAWAPPSWRRTRQEVAHAQPQDRRGREVLQAPGEVADVLVENFRPGVMARLGLSTTSCARQPAAVYCAISGFGQDGPMRDAPAYDQIIQGCPA